MPATTTGSLTTTGSVVLSKPISDTLANIQINGTYGTVTLVFEGSINGGSNYFALPSGDMTTGNSNQTGTLSPTDNSTYAWRVPCEGCTHVRLRATAVGSGTLNVEMSSFPFGAVPLSPAQLAGTITGATTFNGNLTLNDAITVAVGTSTGTKIGTTTLQKIGFWNVTPVVQPTASTNATTGTTGASTGVSLDTTFKGSSGSSAYTIGGIVTALKAVGIVAA